MRRFWSPTPSAAYRAFIEGWFSGHIPEVVLPIATGQLTIAFLLARSDTARRLGVAGATIFLLAIAPLGVGSGFPFGLTAIASLLVMERGLAAQRRPGVSPAARFVPVADARDEHCVEVAAPAGVVFEAATRLDLLSEPVPAALVRLRAALVGDRPVVRKPRGLVAETLGMGWGVLHYEPGRARFRTETRVAATDGAARRHFRRYWLLFGSGIRLIRWSVLRSVRRDAERRSSAPGRTQGQAA